MQTVMGLRAGEKGVNPGRRCPGEGRAGENNSWCWLTRESSKGRLEINLVPSCSHSNGCGEGISVKNASSVIHLSLKRGWRSSAPNRRETGVSSCRRETGLLSRSDRRRTLGVASGGGGISSRGVGMIGSE